MGPPPGEEPPFVVWGIIGLVLSFVCQGYIFGVPTAILAFIGKDEWDKGRYQPALDKLKWAKLIAIIGLALIGLVILLYVMIIGLGLATAFI